MKFIVTMRKESAWHTWKVWDTVKSGTETEITTGRVSTRSITKSEMAVVTECEPVSVMECELTNIEHYSQQLKMKLKGRYKNVWNKYSSVYDVNNLN